MVRFKYKMENKEKPKVYLNAGSIPMWERPVKEGYHRLPTLYYIGHNEPIKFLGIDSVNEQAGKFLVSASATKYLSKIIHLTNELFTWREDAEEILKKEGKVPEEEVLFNGGIQIYEKGIIPGIKIEGYYLKSAGVIWIAQKPTKKLLGKDGLKQIIFGELESTRDIEKRIEAIINGYDSQEYSKEQRQSAAIAKASKSGIESGRWLDRHGYSGF